MTNTAAETLPFSRYRLRVLLWLAGMLGFLLARAHWGHAYVPEAMTTVVELAFRNATISRIRAACAVDNIAPARVLEKAGFTREEIKPRFSIHPNIAAEPRDCYLYAIARNEIPT